MKSCTITRHDVSHGAITMLLSKCIYTSHNSSSPFACLRLPICAPGRLSPPRFPPRSSCALHGVPYVARLQIDAHQIDVVTAIFFSSLVLLAFWMNCVRKRKFNNNNKKFECTWDILLHAVMCVGWLAGRSKDQWFTIARSRSRFSEFNYNFHRQPTHEGVKERKPQNWGCFCRHRRDTGIRGFVIKPQQKVSPRQQQRDLKFRNAAISAKKCANIRGKWRSSFGPVERRGETQSLATHAAVINISPNGGWSTCRHQRNVVRTLLITSKS